MQKVAHAELGRSIHQQSRPFDIDVRWRVEEIPDAEPSPLRNPRRRGRVNQDINARNRLGNAFAGSEIANGPLHALHRAGHARQHAKLMAALLKLRDQRAAEVPGTA